MRILVTGASGQLGAYLLAALRNSGHEVVACSGSQSGEREGLPLIPLPLDDIGGIAGRLDEHNPDAVLHAGAISKPALVLEVPDLAQRVNVEATRAIAAWCMTRGRRLVFTSTDLVFDGTRSMYIETDPVNPTGAYAATKVAAEQSVLTCPGGVVARLSLLYGPSRHGADSYFDRAIANLRAGIPQAFFVDEWRTPLDYETAARALIGLVESDATGIVHVGGGVIFSRWDLMTLVADGLGVDRALVQGNSIRDYPGPEPRPVDVSLSTARLKALIPGFRPPLPNEAARSWFG